MAIHNIDLNGDIKSVEHVGRVLKVSKGVSYRIMSDVWGYADEALVWDDKDQKPTKVVFRTCDYDWSCKSFAEVDADADTRLAYANYLVRKEVARVYNERLVESQMIEVGCQIEVVRGRKVKKGTKGKVVYKKNFSSGWGYRQTSETKLCVATSDKTEKVVKNGREFDRHVDVVWVSEHNCVRTDAPAVSREEIFQEVVARFREGG